MKRFLIVLSGMLFLLFGAQKSWADGEVVLEIATTAVEYYSDGSMLMEVVVSENGTVKRSGHIILRNESELPVCEAEAADRAEHELFASLLNLKGFRHASRLRLATR